MDMMGMGGKNLKAIPKLFGGHDWILWQFLWVDLINYISRYFHVISVIISDKMR